MRALAASFVLVALAAARTASAADDAGAPPDAGAASDTCIEQIPKGATRPSMTDTFPDRAASGFAALLTVTIQHGKGERVLPAGLESAATTEAKKRLKEAGFVLPTQTGTAAGRVTTRADEKGTLVTSQVELPLVPLPETPGRSLLHLPPLPIAVARANGEMMTLCTASHWVTVEDPIANEPEAKPKPNPPGRPQREEWTALKLGLALVAVGIVLGAALAFLLRWWRARPLPTPPPPPPRPPWEVALEKLAETREAALLEAGRHPEYIDRVSDAVRGYLGARFGFDGLESTTAEILTALRTSSAGFVRLDEDAASPRPVFGAAMSYGEIKAFLEECDLVKFAKLVPSTEQCEAVMDTGVRIVRSTMPVSSAASERPS